MAKTTSEKNGALAEKVQARLKADGLYPDAVEDDAVVIAVWETLDAAAGIPVK